MLADVVACRESLVDRIVADIRDDRRVRAIWLNGSLRRGGGDALSDVDLTIVVGADGPEVVAERMAIASRVGALVALLDSPHNAPVDGAQVNALCDVVPLRVYVDWTFWPTTNERPTDIDALFERDAFSQSDRTWDEVQRDFPKGLPPENSEQQRSHFRYMMLPIVAKFAARGWDQRVAGIFAVIEETPPSSLELSSVVAVLSSVLESVALDESTCALEAVRRYLETIGELGGLSVSAESG